MKLKDLLKEAYKDNMTLEEIEAALEGVEVDTSEVDRLKSALTKSNSEAAEYKKQLRAKQTDDEAKEAERARELASMKEELELLKQEKVVSEYTSRYLALGYEDALARETAAAFAKGEMDTVFANQKKHAEAAEKKLRADILKGTPAPPAGTDTAPVTKETFLKMGSNEQYEYIQKNPNWKNELK
jgi:hypothetical protein